MPSDTPLPLPATFPRRNKFLLIAVACGLLASCTDTDTGGGPPQIPDTATTTAPPAAINTPSGALPWLPDMDPERNEAVVRQSGAPTGALTVEQAIAGLNAIWPEVELQFHQRSGDTLVVAIPDSHYLTNQMGSSGAMEYIAAATYNLTEAPGLRCVQFQFEEGDHLAPGTFSRRDFREAR